jgi:hypothetical protein
MKGRSLTVSLGAEEAQALIDSMRLLVTWRQGMLLDALVELRGEAWKLAFVSATCALLDAINRQHLHDGEVALRLGGLRAQLDQWQAEAA